MEDVESTEVIFVFYIMKRYYNYLQKIFPLKLVKAQTTDQKMMWTFQMKQKKNISGQEHIRNSYVYTNS
jgi:hypothetical protein